MPPDAPVTVTIKDRDGTHDLTFHDGDRPAATMTLTGHQLDDLLAVLEQRKAMGRYCGAADGEHACVMPPGHTLLPHVCRACDHEWTVT